MNTKLILLLVSLALIGFCYCYTQGGENFPDKSLEIRRIKNVELPIKENANDTFTEKVENSQHLQPSTYLNKEIKDDTISDPYEELRRKGSAEVRNDTSAYVESTVKLENNLGKEDVTRGDPSAKDPYSDLRENNSEEVIKDTSEYVNSTTPPSE